MKTCKKNYDYGGGFTRCGRPAKHKGACGPFKHKLVDQENHRLRAGDQVSFIVPATGVVRTAFVVGRDKANEERISVQIAGDPFPVGVLSEHLIVGSNPPKTKRGKKVAKTETIDRKELRKTAKSLSIPEWESMDEAALSKAIKEAQDGDVPTKATAKKNGKGKVGKVTKKPRGETKFDEPEAKRKAAVEKIVKAKNKVKKADKKLKDAKASSKKSTKAKAAKKNQSFKSIKEPVAFEGTNPFREKSHSWYITEALIKGGLRAKMIDKLLKKIEFHPWGGKKAKDLDHYFTMDKRILMVVHQLQYKYGFTIVHYGEGRGPEKGSIQVFPPGVAVPAKLKSIARTINGERVGAPVKRIPRNPVPAKTKATKPAKKTSAKKASAKKTAKPAKKAAKAKKK